ncbi:MAG: hypothetical protein R3E58_19070 [Phycisphaerae bacterium]
MAVLRELTSGAKGKTKDEYTQQRLGDMLEFFESMTTWYGQMRRLPKGALVRLMKMGDKVLKMIPGGGK